MARASFLELPDELILLLADCLVAETDLNPLVRTNKRLNTILDPVLYTRHVRLSAKRARHSNTHKGCWALLWAAAHGRLPTAKKAIQAGAHIDGRMMAPEDSDFDSEHSEDDESGWVEEIGAWPYYQTPLLLASTAGHTTIVRFLLEEGADVEVEEGIGCTSLTRAAEMGHAEVVRVLLDVGRANVNAQNHYQHTPLTEAAGHGHAAVVKMLLDTGDVDADVLTRNDETALTMAIRRGHSAVVKVLLESGMVEPDLKDHNGMTPLHVAVQCRQEDIVRMLLETGRVNANSKNIFSNTAVSYLFTGGPFSGIEDSRAEGIANTLLRWEGIEVESDFCSVDSFFHWASTHGFIDVMKLLLEMNPGNVNTEWNDGWGGLSPLRCAAEGGHVEAVEFLLRVCNVDPNTMADVDGRSPLSAAVANSHSAVVRILLDGKDVNVNAVEKNGMTPLNWAVKVGHRDMTQWLLQRGASPIGANAATDISLLLQACDDDSSEIAEMLLEKGADPYAVNPAGYTALHFACRNGNITLANRLLAAAANSKKAAYNGSTPLLEACNAGNDVLFNTLRDKGADPLTTLKTGWTTLHGACKSGNARLVEMLLSYNLESLITAKTYKESSMPVYEKGSTPLYEACRSGNPEIVCMLLAKGANPLIRVASGRTCLHAACNTGNIATMELLLSKGAYPVSQTEWAWRPIHEAASRGHLEAVRMLHESHGVHVDFEDDNQRTPIFYAAARGHDDVVKYLLENGAQHDCRDYTGCPLLFVAARNGHVNIVRRLLVLNPAAAGYEGARGETFEDSIRLLDNDELKELVKYPRRFVRQVKGAGGLERLLQETTGRENESVSTSLEKQRCYCDICTCVLVPGTAASRCTSCDMGDFLICHECMRGRTPCKGPPLDDSHTWVPYQCRCDL
ncbi:ankyrin repeats (3 copies) domain-containing protein [Pochonia chlamydosporia 170]|uniref:Ankyrin repeats (3 copies) domain-containing protein n=1 Tax=Pochonia chlamydosporia 170 TaxID=1380566 RepID=A0A179FWX6_METCM|nr:ankyrin repeats (3 copies) domain-containing protein [Pochonia chlamydosporia 170]OAQ70165.1 ankyrin repeats (3 copies) domain-containing protein [Pochonia chlamydosporia 170]